MPRKKTEQRPDITIEAHKLADLPKYENTSYSTILRNKDRFAKVRIRVGEEKTQTRYLTSKDTEALRNGYNQEIERFTI